MSITINNGGVLKTLSEISINNGGTLYSLNSVSANVGGGIIEEVFSKNIVMNNINSIKWYTDNTRKKLYNETDVNNNSHSLYWSTASSSAYNTRYSEPITFDSIFTINIDLSLTSMSASGGGGISLRVYTGSGTNVTSNDYADDISGNEIYYSISCSASAVPISGSKSFTLSAGTYRFYIGGSSTGYNSTGGTISASAILTFSS